MKLVSTYQLCLVLLFGLFSTEATACCSMPLETLVEVLHHPRQGQSIFSVKVFSTSNNYIGGYVSRAVVLDRYFTAVPDTITLKTGGNTTAGGLRLIEGATYFVFGFENKQDETFGAFVCDTYSSQIDTESHPYRPSFTRGLDVYNAVNEYRKIVEQKYTGHKQYEVSEQLIAEGNYLDGKPDGEWKFYKILDSDSTFLHCTKNYQEGKLHGTTKNVFMAKDPTYQIAEYENDQLISERQWTNEILVYEKTYTYHEGYKVIQMERLDSNGETIERRGDLVFDAEYYYRPGVFLWSVLHGRWLNKDFRTGKLSSKGTYHLGKKVGLWLDEQNTDSPQVQMYSPYDSLQGQTLLYQGENLSFGKLQNGKPIGKWTKYNKDSNTITSQVYSEGIPNGAYHSRSSKFVETGQYANGKLEGLFVELNTNGDTLRVGGYKAGRKVGEHRSYFPNGDLRELANYARLGRKVGLYLRYLLSKQTANPYLVDSLRFKDGGLHGPAKHFRSRTGQLYAEGNYWNSHKIGTWKELRSKGKSAVKEFETKQYWVVKEKNSSNIYAVEEKDFHAYDWLRDGTTVLRKKF